MPVMTVTLSPRADQYVRSKVARRADLGRFISDTLVEAQTREQLRAELAQQRPTPQREWDSSGCHVEP